MKVRELGSVTKSKVVQESKGDRTVSGVLSDLLKAKKKQREDLITKYASELNEKEICALIDASLRLEKEAKDISSKTAPLRAVVKRWMEEGELDLIEATDGSAVLTEKKIWSAVSPIAVAQAIIERTKENKELEALFNAYFSVNIGVVEKQEGSSFLKACGGTKKKGTPSLSIK